MMLTSPDMSTTVSCSRRFVNRAVLRLLADAGTMALALDDELLRGLRTEHLQYVEIWSFVMTTPKRVPEAMKNKSITCDM